MFILFWSYIFKEVASFLFYLKSQFSAKDLETSLGNHDSYLFLCLKCTQCIHNPLACSPFNPVLLVLIVLINNDLDTY